MSSATKWAAHEKKVLNEVPKNRFEKELERRGIKSTATFPGSRTQTSGDDRLNAFQKHALAQAASADTPTSDTTTAEGEFVNRFVQNDRRRAAIRRDTSVHEARIAERKRRREAFINPNRVQAKVGTGLVNADLETMRLKAASDDDRLAARAGGKTLAIPSPATVAAIAAGFVNATPGYHRCEFNNANLYNAFLFLFFRKYVDITVEGFTATFEYIKEHGFYDDIPATTNGAGYRIRPRGIKFTEPKIFGRIIKS